jgi:lipopolysaccharide transport system ATP-binding protein
MIQFHSPAIVAPPSSVVGVLAEGACSLLADVARLTPGDPMPDTPGSYILDHTLAMSDAVTKTRAAGRLVQLRAAGSTIVLISSDEPLLESCADEIWWIRDEQLIARGDPAEVFAKYRAHVAEALRTAGENQTPHVAPTMRKGDGRATLEGIELLGEHNQPSTVWRSGEPVAIAITIRFATQIKDPVVGIMVRSRIGLNVYGTNTELEHLPLGPVNAGDTRRVTYRFKCDLCPGQYTVTAASHDPDGLWHDWMEDAVAFSVTDSRYTAGVANLRATVEAAPVTSLPK